MGYSGGIVSHSQHGPNRRISAQVLSSFVEQKDSGIFLICRMMRIRICSNITTYNFKRKQGVNCCHAKTRA